ncbi:MAG: hypothetical protein JXB39_05620 [Deltaproteobacteria bacterium]|nr:hypothetical protein [Deltaproteobacteria bacterium]
MVRLHLPISLSILVGLVGGCRARPAEDPHEGVDDTADDSGVQGDTGDTGDTGGTGPPRLDRALLAPPDGWYAASYHTVEPGRGLAWERDMAFRIENFTVPQVYVRPDGILVMLATSMTTPEAGRWYLTSPDGLEWTPASESLLDDSDFPVNCGNRLEDGFLLPTSDHGFRLVLEGTLLDEKSDRTIWRRWCQATSPDAIGFTPIGDYFYEGSPNDAHVPSVPSPFLLADGSALVYYVGDLYNDASRQGNGIRIARVPDGGDHAEPWASANVLPAGHVDPMPVYLEGGGLRLYHTMSSQTPEVGPGPGVAESGDASTFTPPVRLLEGEGNCNDPKGGECLLDPVYLRLPDGTMLLYFTWLRSDAEGRTSFGIGRAFATD